MFVWHSDLLCLQCGNGRIAGSWLLQQISPQLLQVSFPNFTTTASSKLFLSSFTVLPQRLQVSFPNFIASASRKHIERTQGFFNQPSNNFTTTSSSKPVKHFTTITLIKLSKNFNTFFSSKFVNN